MDDLKVVNAGALIVIGAVFTVFQLINMNAPFVLLGAFILASGINMIRGEM